MTTIPSPYEHLSSDFKSRVQANIDKKVYDDIFYNVLPRRGTQDRLVSIFIAWLHSQLPKIEAPNTFESEQKLIQLLQPLIDKKEIQVKQHEQTR